MPSFSSHPASPIFNYTPTLCLILFFSYVNELRSPKQKFKCDSSTIYRTRAIFSLIDTRPPSPPASLSSSSSSSYRANSHRHPPPPKNPPRSIRQRMVGFGFPRCRPGLLSPRPSQSPTQTMRSSAHCATRTARAVGSAASA